ncbi:tRNA lysidine(34) synthetase TilS [Pseudenhygromyxa sp. WMMC2535]|uniref:tRNA lysidine(34) synthetase TilS n=1 Tax=Pseudenhygromyxa sp. WMMC2535 TaxID=2712867 RepID=UPI0015956C41|nr:tRNA lysidine(34) synthetase TilS [Pseudenhygromyxa sp. WMMC2535]
MRRALVELVELERPRRLHLACSGGADSMATLGLLTLLRRSEDLAISVGHVDHGLRSSSADEARQVSAIAEGLGFPVRVSTLALEPGPGLPARARQMRRRALLDQADELGAEIVVLAHSATDQAETMLMHMTRGCGLEGVSAMATRDGRWLRPVLQLTRAQLRDLARRLELPFVDDPTNEDLTHLRVWLREAVLPPLRERNPRIDRAFVELAEQAREAEIALDAWARREVDARVLPDGGWHLASFEQLPRAVRTRALRIICDRAGADLSELRRRVLVAMEEAALNMAQALASGPGAPRPAPRGWDLAPALRLSISKNGVHLRPQSQPTGEGAL